MTVALAAGGGLQGAAALAAAAAAAAALVVDRPRRRAAAMLAALALAALAVGLLAEDALRAALAGRAALAAAGAAVAAVALAVLALALRRWPVALALLAVAVLPFRVPVTVGDETASLLVPLYVVIGAGCVAFALASLRPRPGVGALAGPVPADRPLRRLRVVAAAVLVLYAAQSLYSTDPDTAVKNLCFFYVPFALLLVLLYGLGWPERLTRDAFRLTVALAFAFAVVGIVEYATGHLLITNTKVLDANELKPYFRVNSLFFDPNIYGRYLALTMIGLSAVLLWTRRARQAAILGAILAVLWCGLVLSLSQSSFGALLAGLAVLAALRWRALAVLAAVGAGVVATVAVALVAGSALGLPTTSERAIDRATSGRLELLGGGVRMIVDRPVWGFGSGAFAERYRAREEVRSEEVAAISHTTPLTVTAEQGVIGLLGYLALLWAVFAVLLGGVRTALRSGPAGAAVSRAAVAAMVSGLVLHTLVYASFLEDPLLWALLAVGTALAASAREQARAQRRRGGAPAPGPAAARPASLLLG